MRLACFSLFHNREIVDGVNTVQPPESLNGYSPRLCEQSKAILRIFSDGGIDCECKESCRLTGCSISLQLRLSFGGATVALPRAAIQRLNDT